MKQKKKKQLKKKRIGTARGTYAKAPPPLPFINYVCIIFFLLCVLEEKLKRAIVFLIPLGWKHLLLSYTVHGHPAD